MCRSTVDIQSATAEIRRGIKKKKIEERRKKLQGKNIISASATQGGHKKQDETRMWANAQPDGRPAEHRWRPLFNVAKFD